VDEAVCAPPAGTWKANIKRGLAGFG